MDWVGWVDADTLDQIEVALRAGAFAVVSIFVTGFFLSFFRR